MDGIAHPLGLHRLGQQPVSGHHDPRIARLHRNDRPVESDALANPQKLHGRNDHPLRRVAPLVEHALGQRTVVDADAQSDAPLAALLDKRFQFTVFRAIVAWVDPHFVDILRRHGSGFGQKMDVGDQRHVQPLLAHTAGYVLQVFGFAPSLRREPDDAPARRSNPPYLGHARFGVVGVGVGHRLHGNGMRPADGHRTERDFARRPPGKFCQLHFFVVGKTTAKIQKGNEQRKHPKSAAGHRRRSANRRKRFFRFSAMRKP